MKKLVFAVIALSQSLSAAFASDLCTARGGEVLDVTIVDSREIGRVCMLKEVIQGYPMASFIGFNDLVLAAAGKKTAAAEAFLTQAAGDHAGVDQGASICSKVQAQLVGVVYLQHQASGAHAYCRFQDSSMIEALTLIASPQEYSNLGDALK